MLIGAGIGPFPERGLDEAFGLAVGAWGVGAGEAVFDVLTEESAAKGPITVATSVVGQQAANGDAEAGVMSACHKEEADGRAMRLVGQDGGEADAGVIPSATLRAGSDGGVEILPAGAAHFLGAVAVDAMAGADYAGHA